MQKKFKPIKNQKDRIKKMKRKKVVANKIKLFLKINY